MDDGFSALQHRGAAWRLPIGWPRAPCIRTNVEILFERFRVLLDIHDATKCGSKTEECAPDFNTNEGPPVGGDINSMTEGRK